MHTANIVLCGYACENKDMSDAKLEAYFFTAIFLITLVLCGYLFYPFLGSLALAIVLASLVAPFYTRVHARIKSENLSAFIVTVLITLAIILPAIGIFFLLLEEIQSITAGLTSDSLNQMPGFVLVMQNKLITILPFLESVDFSEIIKDSFQSVGTNLGGIISGTTSLVFKFFISLIALFYFIKDGKMFLRELIKLSPLEDSEDDAIVKKLNTVSHSLIRGTLVIATLQGLLTGLGFLMFGVPNPVLWGSLAAVSALVPTLGTGIILLPAVIFLFATGSVAAGIGLAAWGTLVVGLLDNILAPKLIGGRSKIHPLFILLSVLGGLATFGIAGFLLGPLVLGFLVALSEIYKVKINEIHKMSV